ncbi:putative oxidoreductase [Geoalkalibacter ferrihydriticus]|uniref:DoxX family protein n=2 Tax=Geoalkalibacter ferrihydriticus TaxID=392333 RepID=A0A0C2HY40_9BACT|nr:DoxX family protein [Geoalkalibacter ferrihydriticus]KIH77637.1 DoxX family protein [Geoalkalibacter ferrihydriticus DSM 17813]SDL71404.1 putative oxidoreductase [Geoalkalibacter ferrihydriticus]
MWRFLNKYRDIGLLLMRLGLGVMFLVHGVPKLLGGPERWYQLGLAMSYLGIDFMPHMWGIAAALAETLGALCLIFGFFMRPACLVLACTMAVAATMHLGRGDGLQVASHAIELGIVFCGLLILGPGRFSLDRS